MPHHIQQQEDLDRDRFMLDNKYIPPTDPMALPRCQGTTVSCEKVQKSDGVEVGISFNMNHTYTSKMCRS